MNDARAGIERLARLVRLRAHAERAARIELARALAERREAEDRLNVADAEVRRVQRRIRARFRNSWTVREWIAAQLDVEAAEAVRRGALRGLEQRAAEAERALDSWRAARRDHEALRRLLERRREEWREALARAEQRVLDEAALVRHARRRAATDRGGRR